ncbi:MAG TPA: His/Gly/Thr/Pro-type tRNA ligase C-terminal domain-containing protein [Actinomycetota bacterium]
MIRRGLFALAAIGALVGSGCTNELGATPPSCPPPDYRQVESAIIMEAQAVPSARFGPCLDRLETGWKAHDLQAESGRAWFWLDSDRVGDRFLTVSLVEACDTAGAEEAPSGIEGVRLLTRTEATTPTRAFAVVPVADRHLAWAEELAGLLRSQEVSGEVDASGRSLSDRIATALDAGRIVLIVDDVDVENRTAAIRTPVSPDDEAPGQSLEQIRRLFEAAESDETFRGEWFQTFEGGCIVYGFDAEGPGAARIADEVRGALGVVPLEEIREQARSAGFDI